MAKRKSSALTQTTLFQSQSRTKPNAKNKASTSRGARKYGTVDSDSDELGGIELEKPIVSESSSSSSSDSSSSSEDDAPIQPTRSNKGKAKAVQPESDDEDEDDVVPRKRTSKRASVVSDEDEDSPVPKRRRLSRRRPLPAEDDMEVDSIAEEVEDLQSSDSDHIIKERFRARKLTKFQQNLEKLKKRKLKKAGGPQAAVISSEESEQSEHEEPVAPRLFRGAKPQKKKDSLFGSGGSDDGSDAASESEESSAESNFIVEDDGLAAPQLPAAFSMQTHQDIGHQFKKVFQFFVHVAVHRPKKRKEMMEKLLNEEYFYVPLVMMRRKLSGLRDSLVASSVWRPEFKKALEKYPDFSINELDFTIPGCDACHFSGRKSTRRGILAGTPYDKVGFCEQKPKRKTKKAEKQQTKKGKGKKKVESSSSESESESEDEQLKKEFDLGRFCAARTEVYHEYCHWEVETFKVIDKEISELRMTRDSNESGRGFYRVAYGGGKAPPDDLMDADGVCDWLDSRQIIDMEWQRIKGLMERARTLEVEYKRGGGRD